MENQTETIFLDFIRYNHWANAQILAACQNLTTEQLNATAPGTFGSIRDTLWHIIEAEADYIGLITGSMPRPAFRWEDHPDIEALRAFEEQVAIALLDTARRTPPDQIVHVEEDDNTMDYKARPLFIQIINHGIEHRTNITTILSTLGLPAPRVDGWGYLYAYPETFALKETFKESPNADH